MTNSTTNPTQADLDDIMSSIRTGVEAESGKPPSGSADLLEQAAAEGPTEDITDNDDDILELTPAELVSAPAAPVAEAAAPAAEPAANVADILGVPTLSAADEAADEFDKLLAEISEEKKTRAADVAAEREALLADIEPLGEPVAAPVAVAELVVTESAAEQLMEVAAPEPILAAPVALPAAAATHGTTHTASLTLGDTGLPQLVLPMEVLTAALQPMVQQWLAANLAPITEKLVQAEIAKLNS